MSKMAYGPHDDLEYYIKFPSSSSKELTPRCKNDLPFIYDNEKLPVVVLLGWAGCQDKYLAKYSAIYELRGCITLRCTAPVIAIFVRHGCLPRLSEKLLDLLHDMTLDEHPIFFHVFSNGGAFFYQHISFQMQREDKKLLQVKGVIFDSAPGEKRFYSIYRALEAIYGGSMWYKVPLAFISAIILFVYFLLVAYINGLIRLKKPQTDPIVLVDEPFDWPQLFIYSKDDELVRGEDIEKFALNREKRGIRVERLCFEKSPHVQHLLTDQELYSTTVFNFLQSCLN